MIDLINFTTEQLLNAMPQNRPLYKDSGLWQIRTDDMEGVLIDQNTDETFRDFIERYYMTLLKDDISVAVSLLYT